MDRLEQKPFPQPAAESALNESCAVSSVNIAPHCGGKLCCTLQFLDLSGEALRLMGTRQPLVFQQT